MAGGKRRAVRESGLVDFIADFGVLPGPLSYEEYIGLKMASQRVRLRKVYFQALAQTLSIGLSEVPEEVIMAACETPQAGKRLAFEINAARNAKKSGF